MVIAFLIILSVLFTLNIRNNSNGITAMEGLVIAENRVSEEYEGVLLVAARSFASVDSSGHCDKWLYYYRNANQTLEVQCIVSKNGSIELIEDFLPGPYLSPLTNWTIDSDKSVELAVNDSSIKAYLNQYNNARIESIYFTAGMENNTTTFCWIEWSDSGFMDDPHSAVIKLDANTGEVLYVDVQL